MARKAGGGQKAIVTGVKELDAILRDLEPKLARKYIRKGMRDGMKLVRDQARADAPVRSGTMRKAIKVRAGRSRKRGRIAIEVRVGEGDFKGDTFYGAFVEYGTSRQKAQEFMLRAFRERGEAARREIIAAIVSGVQAARKG